MSEEEIQKMMEGLDAELAMLQTMRNQPQQCLVHMPPVVMIAALAGFIVTVGSELRRQLEQDYPRYFDDSIDPASVLKDECPKLNKMQLGVVNKMIMVHDEMQRINKDPDNRLDDPATNKVIGKTAGLMMPLVLLAALSSER